MNRTLIAAIDESAEATTLLDAAVAYARLIDAAVEVAHVVEDGSRTVRRLAASHRLDLHLLRGPVTSALAELARRPDVVSMAIGLCHTPTDGRAAADKTLQLITSLDKPVLVVPPTIAPPRRIRRVLVPLDGSEAAAAALAETFRQLHGGGAQVVVVHVVDQTRMPAFEDQPSHDVGVWGGEFLARNVPLAAGTARLEVRCGPDVWRRVLATAGEHEADLVVVAWSRRLERGRAAVVKALLERGNRLLLLMPVVETAEHAGKEPLLVAHAAPNHNT